MPGTELPKFWFPHGAAEVAADGGEDPASTGFNRSQSGDDSCRCASVHVRVVDVTMRDSGLVAV